MSDHPRFNTRPRGGGKEDDMRNYARVLTVNVKVGPTFALRWITSLVTRVTLMNGKDVVAYSYGEVLAL